MNAKGVTVVCPPLTCRPFGTFGLVFDLGLFTFLCVVVGSTGLPFPLSSSQSQWWYFRVMYFVVFEGFCLGGHAEGENILPPNQKLFPDVYRK